MFGGIIAGGAGSVAKAFETVEVGAILAGVLDCGLVISIGTDVIAEIFSDHEVGDSGVTVFDLEEEAHPGVNRRMGVGSRG